MNTRKILLTVLGILIIIASVFVAQSIINSKKTPRPKPEKVIKTVFVDTVKNGNVSIIIPANGNLSAKQRMELYSEVQGVFRKGSKLKCLKCDESDYRLIVDPKGIYANLRNFVDRYEADFFS